MEFFCLGYEDEVGNFKFQSFYRPADIEQGRSVHQLYCPNSFYRKRRTKKDLHTLYALCLDIDGISEPFPLSVIDILERWNELGFSKPPTTIICTSPGHYHAILRLIPLSAFPDKISFWEKCQQGMCDLFQDMGSDFQPSTSFTRIPGHRNCKHPNKPLVETVFASDSMFTLSEVYGVLKENGIQKRNVGDSTVEAQIKTLLEGGVPYGKRDRTCFTLAIHFNKNLGLSQDEALERLMEWNTRLPEPLKPREICKCVRSAYKGDYFVSPNWLNYLTGDESPAEIQKSYAISKHKKKPFRTCLKIHVEKIRNKILMSGGCLEISQRRLAKQLRIPWQSYLRVIRIIPELEITITGHGRYAKSTLRLVQNKTGLRLVSGNGT